jgi:hypothetical protein
VFAIVISVWMGIVGFLMWRHAREYDGLMEARSTA